MGTSQSVNVSIQLDRPDAFYYAGESVAGTIHACVNAEQVKVAEIYIALCGQAGFRKAHIVQEADSTQRTNVCNHTATFLSQRQLLDSAKVEEQALVYHEGHHTWRFDMELPSRFPPTIGKPGVFPFVQYYLDFVGDGPWCKRTEFEKLYLTVFPKIVLPINSRYTFPSTFNSHNRKDVTLQGTVDKVGYKPGDTIMGTLTINNPRRALVRHIHVDLIQNYEVGDDSEQQMIIRTKLPNIVNIRDKQLSGYFRVAIPDIKYAPSCEFIGNAHNTVKMLIRYTLKITVKVEGIYTDFYVNVPLKLVTEFDANSNNADTCTCQFHNQVHYRSEAIVQPHLDPPSYESVTSGLQ